MEGSTWSFHIFIKFFHVFRVSSDWIKFWYRDFIVNSPLSVRGHMILSSSLGESNNKFSMTIVRLGGNQTIMLQQFHVLSFCIWSLTAMMVSGKVSGLMVGGWNSFIQLSSHIFILLPFPIFQRLISWILAIPQRIPFYIQESVSLGLVDIEMRSVSS